MYSTILYSRYMYVHMLAVYAQLLSQCTLSAYHIRIDHPSNKQSMFNQYQPNDHRNDRFQTDSFGVGDMRRNVHHTDSREAKALPLNDMAFNSKPDPFVDNNFFDDFRKELPNENKFHKQSKEVHKFHTHLSRIDENSNDGNGNDRPPKSNTDHHIYNNNNHQRKQTETIDNDGFDKNVDFKFIAEFPSERLIKNDEFFSPKRVTTRATDKPRKTKKSFDYEDTIGDLNMNNKHTDEPDELKTEVTNRDDVLRYHSNQMDHLKSRLNHISTDPNYYQHNSDISHDDRTPIYDDNQPKNFEDRFSLDPRTHINKMLNYFNAYPSTALIDHNANNEPHPLPKRDENTQRQHIYHYHPQTNADHSSEKDNRFNAFDSQRESHDSDRPQQYNQKKRVKQQDFAPWVREVTTIIPSDDQNFLFKPIDEPASPTLPDIDLFIKHHNKNNNNNNNNRKQRKRSGKMKKDENFYDDFDEMPKHSDDEQTKKQVEKELSKATPTSQYTPHDDTPADEKTEHNSGDSRSKPSNFEQEVDISSADLERYFDREFSNFHSDNDSNDNKPEAEVESDDTPVQPTLIPSHVYRDHEQERADLTHEHQPKLLLKPAISKQNNNDHSDNEGSRRSAKTEEELDEREPDYRTSADFLRDHDDFLKKIDFENEKFKKESDQKSAKQQQEDEEEDSDNNDNEGESKKQVEDGERELDNDDSDNKQDNDNNDNDDAAEDSKVKQKKTQDKQENDKEETDKEESDKEEDNNDAKEDDKQKNTPDNDDDETEETKEEAVENDSVKKEDNDNESDDDSKNEDTDASKKSVSKDEKKRDKQTDRRAVMDLVKSIKEKNVKCEKCDDKLNDIAETKEFRESIPIVPKVPKVPANLPKKVLFLQTSIISTDGPQTRNNKQQLLETETNTISTPITTQIAVPVTVTANYRRVNRNFDPIVVTTSPMIIDLKRINKKNVAHYSPKKSLKV